MGEKKALASNALIGFVGNFEGGGAELIDIDSLPMR